MAFHICFWYNKGSWILRKEGGFLVEVLFGESEAGSMKIAKNIQDSDKVICLGFMMDIGDIKESVDSQYRKDLIYSMYVQDQWGGDKELNEECQKLGDVYSNELKRLQGLLEKGESVRIFVVRLPEYEVRQDNTIVSYSHWGEVFPEEFAQYLSHEKKLSKTELKMYAWNWAELQEDNSPLRAVVNGRVLGVPEDFYDFLIWKRITKKPEKEARLIGDILGNNPIGVGDWWYAQRIEKLISQGKIKVIEDSEKKYARQICLA